MKATQLIRCINQRTVVLAGLMFVSGFGSRIADGAEFFRLEQVRLLDGPFKVARDRNGQVLLAHEVDRLVAPFRTEAGLEPKAPQYPSWESSGLGGQTAGHYLTALAQTWSATGNEEFKRRLEYMVAELAECQRANGDGYLGGTPGGRQMWRDVAAGQLRIESFAVNGKWVPWYNLHKTFAGLRDAWLIAGNRQAREVLIRLADWCDELASHLSEAQMQEMLRAEQGGMNEVLADVSAIMSDPKYLRLAQRFSHRAILDPLLLHEDRLTGLHANTQIPKVIGFARIAELGGDASWLDAARFFYETVTQDRTVAFGGNSVREHFNPVDDFSSVLESREGPETCNTYNMLRLTEQLFRMTPAAHLADYYERALFNHILASIHPEHGGYVYFTPLRPRHYRVYSQAGKCFWCCVGSGMENPGKYGRFIYAHDEDALFLNLFIASELDWTERGIKVRQETSFPDESRSTLRLSLNQPQPFTICIRRPAWVEAGKLQIRINGEPWTAKSSPASYERIRRAWRDGDQIEIELPMRTTLERLQDGSDYVALLHGPILLAAKTGTEGIEGLIADDGRFAHVASGPYLPLDSAPMLVGDPERFAGSIKPVAGKPFTFTASTLVQPEPFKSLELIPFFRVHDARYCMYWRAVSPDQYREVANTLAAREQERLALEARTLDQVNPGEQQPEVEHNYRGEESNSGVNLGRSWRDAGKWFSYDLRSKPGQLAELMVTYFDGDRGRRFDILINGQLLVSERLEGRNADRFVDKYYPIPEAMTWSATNGVLTVKFAAQNRSRAGGVYGLRLLAK